MVNEPTPQPFRQSIELRIDYSRELNPEQLAAVTAPPGPALVIAGAGSGKTRTLIYRVAYLLEQGVPVDRILLLTFTNKAAREMMRRVAELVGIDLSRLWGGTFHAVGHRILRRHAECFGYSPQFTILDRADAAAILRECIDAMQLDVRPGRFPKADVVADVFSRAANTDRPLATVIATHYDYLSEFGSALEDLHGRYDAQKKGNSLVDFDDLLLLWRRLLLEREDIRQEYQRRFQFLLVDEYQDTNKAQAEIVDCLAAKHHNVMAVGDDAQSIYSWRGANFRNIFDFPKRYPDATIYRIETNYRSTPEILAAANAAIAANTYQFTKTLVTARPSGARPALVVCEDRTQQAAFVTRRILELRNEGVAPDQMIVLYRSHFHALDLQLELTRSRIPFSITSGIRFFEQAHIKDVAAHLRLVANPRDELAFKRITGLLPGVGRRTADRLWTAFQNGIQPSALPLAPALQGCAPLVPKKTAVAWAQLCATLGQLSEPEMHAAPGDAIQLVLDAGYEEQLQSIYPEYQNRLEDLGQLASFARQFSSLEDFLGQLALATNLDGDEDRPSTKDGKDEVRLSTIHQAKGLEFDVVFLIMLGDGLFPSYRSLEDPDALEEERRLFYVALTRARNQLYLSYPLVRPNPGRDGEYLQEPSRFLGEIPEDLCESLDLQDLG